MKRAAEFARSFLISPEMLSVVLVAFAAAKWPRLFERVGDSVRSDQFDAAALAILAAPILLIGVAYKLTDETLRPDEATRKILAEWPDYYQVKTGCVVGLLFTVLGLVSWVVGFLMNQLGTAVPGVATALAGVLVAGIAVITLGLARLEVRDILDNAST